MVDTKKLKGLFVERGFNQRKIANMIGISEATMYNKMRLGVFGTDEMVAIADILCMNEAEKLNIFFARKDTF